jgi:hypothetical protein
MDEDMQSRGLALQGTGGETDDVPLSLHLCFDSLFICIIVLIVCVAPLFGIAVNCII